MTDKEPDSKEWPAELLTKPLEHSPTAILTDVYLALVLRGEVTTTTRRHVYQSLIKEIDHAVVGGVKMFTFRTLTNYCETARRRA